MSTCDDCDDEAPTLMGWLRYRWARKRGWFARRRKPKELPGRSKNLTLIAYEEMLTLTAYEEMLKSVYTDEVIVSLGWDPGGVVTTKYRAAKPDDRIIGLEQWIPNGAGPCQKCKLPTAGSSNGPLLFRFVISRLFYRPCARRRGDFSGSIGINPSGL